MSVETLIFSQLLSNESYTRKVLPHLKEDYFNTVEEKNFFKIYNHFFNKHNTIPSKMAMTVEIEKLKASADVYNGIKAIVDSTVEFTETLEYLVDTTESFCKERALFNALREAVLIVDGQSKNKGSASIPTILQDALGVCFDTSVGHDYLEDSDERYDYYHNVESRIPTGNAMIDKITKNGFPRKTLNVLLAPPHGGKSLVMVDLAAGAMKLGHNVLYISCEMAENEIGMRFDVNLMDVDFDTLQVLPKTTYKTQFDKIYKKSTGKLIIKEYATGVASAANFRALLAELKTKQNFVPDLICIDYLNIVASESYKAGSNHNSYTIIGAVGKELRALAKDANAAILTATQTNRSGVGASDVDMTAVSDSASTSMIADWMLAIITTDDLKQLKQLLLKQIKNRYAGTSENEKFLVGVDYSKMKLYSLENSNAPDMPKRGGKNKPADNNVDMLHQIKPAVASFNDFNFEE